MRGREPSGRRGLPSRRKLVADESVELQVIERLRADGHDVLPVAEQAPGIADSWILDTAAAEQRLLLTGDKDFGELVFRQRRATAGVVLLRLAGVSNATKADLTGAAFLEHGAEFVAAFAVVEAGRIRIRRT